MVPLNILCIHVHSLPAMNEVVVSSMFITQIAYNPVLCSMTNNGFIKQCYLSCSVLGCSLRLKHEKLYVYHHNGLGMSDSSVSVFK